MSSGRLTCTSLCVQINSVVSICSTIGRLAIMAVVGASISQSKWLWYKLQSRPLQDIQMFDAATRGPWGSVALLFSVNVRYVYGSRSVVSFGPVLSVCSGCVVISTRRLMLMLMLMLAAGVKRRLGLL